MSKWAVRTNGIGTVIVAAVHTLTLRSIGAPLRALRAFKRVHLKPGEAQKVRFELKERDLSMVTEAGELIIANGQYPISIGGGQPDTGAPTIAGKFQVKGTKVLPE